MADDDVLVSYVGTVGMANGLGALLDAAARLGHDHPRTGFLIIRAWAERDTIRSKAADWALSNLSLTGLVPWERARDILAASDVSLVTLPRLPADRGLRRRLGDAGRQFVQREFDRRTWAESYLALLEQVAVSSVCRPSPSGAALD